jgi:hypothetical protein
MVPLLSYGYRKHWAELKLFKLSKVEKDVQITAAKVLRLERLPFHSLVVMCEWWDKDVFLASSLLCVRGTGNPVVE